MSKPLLQATIRVSEFPRVRFFARAGSAFNDVTHRVAKLVLEDLEQESGACDILRLDAQGQMVWRTRHPSIQEAKWHVEFEYGLPEEKWSPAAPPIPAQ